MQIRSMRESDLEAVAAIEQSLFSDPWSKQGFRESLNQPQAFFYVLTSDEQVIGYCGSYRAFDEAEIVNVAIDQAFQNGGKGMWMLQSVIASEKEAGIQMFILEVRKSNASAIHVYEKIGFTQIGIRRNFYTQPVEDAVIMQLT